MYIPAHLCNNTITLHKISYQYIQLNPVCFLSTEYLVTHMQSLRSALEMAQLDRDEKSDAVAAAEQVCAL